MFKTLQHNRILSILLAFIVFVAGSGMSMDVHFCQGNIIRASIFGKAKTCQEVNACLKKCGKKSKLSYSDSTCSDEGEHKDCCSNKTIQFDMDVEITKLGSDIVEQNIKNIYATEAIFLDSNASDYSLEYIATSYIPPPLERDLTISFQVFRL